MSRTWALWVSLFYAVVLSGQTTQGTIAGRVFDAQTRQMLPHASLTCLQVDVGPCPSVRSDAQGYFTLPLLSPGTYQIRAAASGYQDQEIREQVLPVASRLELTFGLRPAADVYGARTQRLAVLPNGRILSFFAADFETKGLATVLAQSPQAVVQQSALSYTVDPVSIDRLPLNGRDVYYVLALQPGMVSDTSTGRGLGFAANGQRPAASNFLLDGVENNDYLITGPSFSVAPEAVQEYSVSTNNFSAQYGRTSGYIANAVTKSGGEAWHGLGYYYLRNELLNAGDFQKNRAAFPCEPVREARPGFQAGGPLPAGGFLVSLALEALRFGSRQDPATYSLPTTAFQPPAGSIAKSLLDRFPLGLIDPLNRQTVGLKIAPPNHLQQWSGLTRVDRPYRQSRDRLMVRLAYALANRPDFLWSPYRDFVTPLKQDAGGLLVSSTNTLPGGLTSEMRITGSWNQVSFDRRWPAIPTLVSADGTSLPGYPGLYSLRNRNKNVEFSGNVVYPHAAHLFALGGGVLSRTTDGYLDPGAHAVVYFNGLGAFGADSPSSMLLALDRAQPGELTVPPFDRAYRNSQFSLYAQDVWKIAPRLTLDYGFRYENFGVPKSQGVQQDLIVQLGEGATLPQHLMHAKLAPLPPGEPLYHSDHNNFALRAGFAYRVARTPATVIRGAYGIFYDRPFDNLWQNIRNNRFELGQFIVGRRMDYLQMSPALLKDLSGSPHTSSGPDLTLYQPGIRDGYVQNYFIGVSQPAGPSWSIELNAVGSLGRKLITTDLVNRDFSLPLLPGIPSDPSNTLRRFQPALPYISYRANQGSSNHQALTAVARYRSSALQAQISYTLGFTRDNQSDPLAGEFFDLRSVLSVQAANHVSAASFARQFDSGSDWGNSDYDQRHNVVMWATWELPSLTKFGPVRDLLSGWQLSALGALRSGLPYTIAAPNTFSPGAETIVNNRARSIDPSHAFLRQDTDGGKLLLNQAAFTEPAAGTLGDLPRNAAYGPGLASVDLSVSRTVAFRWFGEAGRMTLRADAYNTLNHVNLNNPDALVGSPTFGVAAFGRKGKAATSDFSSPLDERSRQIQILLRLRF